MSIYGSQDTSRFRIMNGLQHLVWFHRTVGSQHFIGFRVDVGS